MTENRKNFIREMSHPVLVLLVVLFSLTLAVMDISLKRENRMLAVYILAAMSCLGLHVVKYFSERARIYIYSLVLMLELFYHTVNADITDDCTGMGMVVVSLFALVMTQEKRILRMCIAAVYSAMAFNFAYSNMEGSTVFSASDTVTVIWHVALILVAAVVADRLLTAINDTETQTAGIIRTLKWEDKNDAVFLDEVSQKLWELTDDIVSDSDLLLEGRFPNGVKDTASRIRARGKMGGIVAKNMGDQIRLMTKSLDIKERDYEISDLARKVLETVGEYKPPEIELEIEVQSAETSCLKSDPEIIKRIMCDLILDGFERTKKGGVYVSLGCSRQKYGANLNISVSDTCEGMSPEELSRILDRFYNDVFPEFDDPSSFSQLLRIAAGLVKKLGGFITAGVHTGMGLAITASIPQSAPEENEPLTGFGLKIPAGSMSEVKTDMPSPLSKDELLTRAGIDTAVGLMYTANDREVYDEVLEQFVSESGEKMEKLREYFGKDDLNNYKILIHSVKSSSKMIGALTLSGKAAGLESAAADGDLEKVRGGHDEAMELYTAVTAGIEKALEGSEADGAYPEDDEIVDFIPGGSGSEA